MKTPRNQCARAVGLDETESDPQAQRPRLTGNLDAFLNALPKNTPGRRRKEIAAQVETDRAGWERIAQASKEQPQK